MDPTKPHTLAAMGSRNTTDIVGKQLLRGPAVPSTSSPRRTRRPTTWNASTLAKCNQCHDPLALHGGNYRDLKTCTMCHNPNNMRGTIADCRERAGRGPRPVQRPGLLAPHPRGAGRGGRSGHDVPAGHPQLRVLPRQDGGRRRQLVHEALDRGLRLLPQRRELHDGREPRGRPGGRRHVRDLPPAPGRTPSGTPASRTPTSFRSTRLSSRATRPRSSRSRTRAPARRSP